MILEEIREAVVYVDGGSYFGATEEVKLPEIQFKTNERKPTGGIGSIETFGGIDKLEMEINWKSYDRKLVATVFNPRKGASLQIRSIKRVFDATGGVAAEIAVVTHLTVKPKSFGLGTHKAGEAIEVPTKFSVSAIKQIVGGETLLDIDVINQVFVLGGENLLATQNQILGIG